MKVFLHFLFCVAVLIAPAAAQSNNILVIIADDVGLDSLALWNSSTNASFPPTPTLDALARQGIVFSNGYAYPTCSPTRAALMTGRYGYRTGVLSPESSGNFSEDEYTLPEVFIDQQLNYDLACMGKWHLGGGVFGPNERGAWPFFSGSLSGGLNNYRRWDKVVNGATTNLTSSYATRINVSDTIDWLATQSASQWFAWVAFNAGHTPLHSPPNDQHSYTLSGLDPTNAPRPFYEAMVEALDTQVGRLLGAVDLNDTTVIFLGDNGTANDVIQPPYDINGRAKGSLYEGGTHVPFFIAGADVVAGGRTNAAVVHCADLFATIIELAGGSVPATAVDSRSLLPIIQNQPFSPTEDCILVESDSLGGVPGGSGRAVRNVQFKLIRVGRANRDELYDMLADPLEGTNLLDVSLSPAASNAYVALGSKLDAWVEAVPVVSIPTNGYPIVDTGQSDYFDDQGGASISPPVPGAAFSGQDAQYDGLHPAYLDNGDGTVTDLNTGLIWQQTPDLTNKTTFVDAFTTAAGLTLGGHTDWRVPTVKELYSLIDFDGETGQSEVDAVPYIDTDYFDFVYGDTNTERHIDAQYWSSTEYVHVTMNGDDTVFGVNFADGRIKGYPKYKPGTGNTVGSTMFVRFVRGNTDYGNNAFVDNGDGTVTDYATGLMWQQADSVTAQNWEQSLAYAEALDLAGYRDWRLPNAKELHSIVDYSRSPLASGSAAIDTNVFDVTEIESFYWTSTTHLDGAPGSVGNYAVYFSFGRALGWINSTLLDVHGAGAQRSDPKSGTPVLDDPGHGPQGDILRINNFARCVRGGATAQGIDSDGDGLSDWYEYDYISNTTAMVRSADSDGDGVINIDERRAGTSPSDSASIFAITDLGSTTHGHVVEWSSTLGQTYSVSVLTTLLSQSSSSVIASNIPATPPLNTLADESTAGFRFYRISTQALP